MIFKVKQRRPFLMVYYPRLVPLSFLKFEGIRSSMSMNLETKFKTILCLFFQHTYLFYLYIITLNIHLVILNRK